MCTFQGPNTSNTSTKSEKMKEGEGKKARTFWANTIWPSTFVGFLPATAAFAADFGSPTVEKPNLAASDLPKCQEQFYS